MTKLYKDLLTRLNSKGYFTFDPKVSGKHVSEFIVKNENILDREVMNTGMIKVTIKKVIADLMNDTQLLTA